MDTMKRFVAIGLRIKELRGKESQKNFAQKIKISLPSLQRYESGERAPTGPALKRIAEVCDVTTDYILTGDEASVLAYLKAKEKAVEAQMDKLIDSIPARLGEIDPIFEQLFPQWGILSQKEQHDVLQYAFYKKKVEKILERIKLLCNIKERVGVSEEKTQGAELTKKN